MFFASTTFVGPREGCVFTRGPLGQGYYANSHFAAEEAPGPTPPLRKQLSDEGRALLGSALAPPPPPNSNVDGGGGLQQDRTLDRRGWGRRDELLWSQLSPLFF